MKYKKSIALLTSFILMFNLSACGKNETEETVATTTAATTTAATTTEATTTTEEETTTTTTELVNGLYDPSNPMAVNPVSGLQDMNPENVGYRSVAIVVNNCYNAMSQRGISQADAIYEYQTEGGQTRLLCVFADVNEVPEIGSLRSARIMSTDLAAGNNSIFIHYGRNARVPDHISAWGIDHIDGNNCSSGSNNSANGEVVLPTGLFFWRDSVWLSQRALEHTAVSDGAHISEGIDYFNIERTGETPLLFNYVPDNSEDIANSTLTCENLNVYFSPTNDDALFEYDAELNGYYKSQYGSAQLDETTGEQLFVNNVVVIYARITGHGDGTVDAYLEEGGEGYYFNSGKYIHLTWTKDSPNDLIVLYNDAGEEVQVNRGITYICVVDNDEFKKISVDDVKINDAE
ncbi:MAG: DUF3048 domain-containing protein [Clostridia bacterium]|nr:DUF3048 domain-containing protein [Clostridia bacterium]